VSEIELGGLALAAGVVRALRSRPRLIVPQGQRVPASLAREYGALCARALAVTENTPRREYLAIEKDFMELANKYELMQVRERVH
jgi:hypothetical protein